MDDKELTRLIKEVINEEVLKEALTKLDYLHDDISTVTMTGNAWYKMISGLESVIDEMKDFRGMYSPNLHGPLPNTNEGMQKLQQIVTILQEMKPIIHAMDDIEKKDR